MLLPAIHVTDYQGRFLCFGSDSESNSKIENESVLSNLLGHYARLLVNDLPSPGRN
jgi:hypothetical protein